MNPASSTGLPLVLAGPIIRRVTAEALVLWLAVSRPVDIKLQLFIEDDGRGEASVDVPLADHTQRLRIGEHAWLDLVHVRFDDIGLSSLTDEQVVGYDMLLGETAERLSKIEPGLCYPGEPRPRFVYRRRLTHLLHGSCRRPHHDSPDAMAEGDRWLSGRRANPADWPTALLLTGDQIYADDVAGPLLRAVHAFMDRAGLRDETLTGADVTSTAELRACDDCYYGRDRLLPNEKGSRDLRDLFFGGAEKPVFTSANASNHLITLSEVLAMYLLCWSDAPWRDLAFDAPPLNEENAATYAAQAPVIERFAAELPAVRRLMANVPVYMIFDDHDVTDDWNLTQRWAAAAYGHPFSRRILGNATLAYLLCQGWGNQPESFDDALLPAIRAFLDQPSEERQSALIDELVHFHDWDFTVETEPAVVFMNTRTRRWHRERLPSRPSGLMDWEALCELQNRFVGREAVVVVSPAPIFGVKLIENVQRVFSWLGMPLMVDAENWMAHAGAAHTLLNIFHHRGTPAHFTVLSGDVHYSFVYDVTLRRGKLQQKIWQITSSGVKNGFPVRLLDWFDRLNRWLYAPWSPFNWFTKRRSMHIQPRKPHPSSRGERLVNGASLGYLSFDAAGRPQHIRELTVDQGEVIFEPDAD
ncbi:MAG: hypothetical protein CMN28_02660 [Salinisphaeraceae bacterium]|nr:hypothetical protein [Salinisphaeraceae bacterium]